MRQIYFVNAIAEALDQAMGEDERVIVLGEDVDRSTIGATKGLIEKYGSNRVRNTPISEATFVGACCRRGGSGTEAVRRPDVLELLLRRPRPGRKPGGTLAIHVWRPGRAAARLLRRHRPVWLSGCPTFREPTSDPDAPVRT